LRVATFGEFAAIWQTNALSQHKPSTQAVVRSQLRKWLIPYFGDYSMSRIGGQQMQMFIQNCRRSPKTIQNLTLTLRMMWNAAKAWGYVDTKPFDGLVLPRITRRGKFFFTVEEIQKILAQAQEPFHTLYWLAAESGMRAGELCGLRVDHMNLDSRVVNIKQSVWRNQVQTPKTDNAVREFSISPQLATHLRQFLTTWRPNSLGLLFATKSPWLLATSCEKTCVPCSGR
jgi:integrase